MKSGTAIELLEADFKKAIDRIRAGKPRNAELKRRLEETGKLPLNVSTVAKEAGRSRTPIAHAGTRYPELRTRVLAYMRAPTPEGKERGLIEKLRNENRSLTNEIKELKAEIVSHFHSRVTAEREAARWKKELERVRARIKGQATVTRLDVVRRPEDA